MAENEKPAEEAVEAKPPRALNLKTLLILASVFLIEGVVIAGVFLLVGEPATVDGDTAAVDEVAEGEKLVEVLVVEDRFPNTLSGRTYLYDTQVYIQIRKKHEKTVGPRLEQMEAQVKGDVAEIFRAAETTQLRETSLGTLKRKILARLEKRLGRDEEGNGYVQAVLIPKCTEYRADI